jgi:hypothetical protein
VRNVETRVLAGRVHLRASSLYAALDRLVRESSLVVDHEGRSLGAPVIGFAAKLAFTDR